jgi:transposase
MHLAHEFESAALALQSVHLSACLSNFGPPLDRVLRSRTEDPVRHPGECGRDRQGFRPNHKLRPAELDDLVAAYQAGASLRALGRQFNVHEQTVRRQLQQRGLVLRQGAKALSAEGLAELAAAYELGRSTYELAGELGVSADTVQRLLRQSGVQLRGRMDWRKRA